jgi:hypothetical protein
MTRPDILTAVGTLCEQFNDYSEAHWRAAKLVLQYLYHSQDLWLEIKASGNPPKLRYTRMPHGDQTK